MAIQSIVAEVHTFTWAIIRDYSCYRVDVLKLVSSSAC